MHLTFYVQSFLNCIPFVLYPTQKANAIASKNKFDAENAHLSQQKIIIENQLLIDSMKIKQREKLTLQQKSHSNTIQLKNAQIE
jgi:hypothetical protein